MTGRRPTARATGRQDDTLAPSSYRIQAMVDGLDQVVLAMERKWGVGRLRLLVSDLLRAKFDEQKDRLDQAIAGNHEGYVRIHADGMRRAWEALDRSAREAGETPLAPEVYRPLDKHGQWCPAALGMATALHVEPSDLWPNYLREIEARSNVVAFDMTLDQFAAVASSHDRLVEVDRVRNCMAALSPRQRLVIEMRYGLNGNGVHTLEEVGAELGVCRERVRQFESFALRKMRSPNRRWRGGADHAVAETLPSAGTGEEERP